MSSNIGGELIVVVILILINAFFAASETALIAARRWRIKQMADDGDASARIAQKLQEDSKVFLATIQVGITLMGFFASALAATSAAQYLAQVLSSLGFAWLTPVAGTLSIIVITLLVSYVTIVFGELVPKQFAMRNAERVATLAARPIAWLGKVARPIVALLNLSTSLTVRLFGGSTTGEPPSLLGEEEIRALVEASEESGVIEEEEREMIHQVFEFGDTLVREVMVPRTEMAAVDADATAREALQQALEAGFSRIPIYEDSFDNITGIFYTRDMLPFLFEGDLEVRVRELARSAYFVPESKRVGELLKELQQKKVHMAIVVDEYGGTAGLVTLEDLLEEIVGEIQDEYDAEEPLIECISENEYEVDGRVTISDVNHDLDLNLAEGEVDTIGGLVLDRLGAIANEGDEVRVNGVVLKVLEVEGHRVARLRLTKLEGDAARGRSAGEDDADAPDNR